MASLHIRDIVTRDIVHSVVLSNTSERYVERVLRGLLRNINVDKYFVDDSEVDKP